MSSGVLVVSQLSDIASILRKIDTVKTTSSSKVELFSCETKSVKIYVLLWFD